MCILFATNNEIKWLFLYFLLQDNDLEKDFSPDEYDRKMNELFSEEFYAGEDLDEKPVFSDDSYEYDCEDIDNEPLAEDIDETVFSNADSQYECQDDETVVEEGEFLIISLWMK